MRAIYQYIGNEQHLPITFNDLGVNPTALIIDNKCSFTQNIRTGLGKLGVDAVVLRNDELTSRDIEHISPSHIIIGPGPGNPHDPEEIGITPAVIDYAKEHRRALLGICLGHQALAAHFGGSVVFAPEAIHGKTSMLQLPHLAASLKYPDILDGINPDADIMRYHSLCVDPSYLPKELAVTSYTRDASRLIMSLQHRTLPLYGVQFHPESFATCDGLKILENFLKIDPEQFAVMKRMKQSGYYFSEYQERTSLEEMLNRLVHVQRAEFQHIIEQKERGFECREFPCDLPPEEVYARLHATSPHVFFFESLPQNDRKSEQDGFSYFGCDPAFVLSACNNELKLNGTGVNTYESSPFDFLMETMEQLQKNNTRFGYGVPKGQRFSGGLVGFMTYEATQYLEPKEFHGRTPEDQQTFSFGYFDDGLVYDRVQKKYFYFTRGRDREEHFRTILKKERANDLDTVLTPVSDGATREEFVDTVTRIKNEEIRTGNSFQTVLSRHKTFRIQGSMEPLYRRLREICPARDMHAIKMGAMESIGSFPELTLRVENGEAVTYQLAGTTKRYGEELMDDDMFQKLSTNQKEVAEHRMLVDLARNDMARFCKLGSITVPSELLMHRCDAGPVMHLASEVRGKIARRISPLRALLTIAPMGTTTGAPKIRSMQIIHEHEDADSRGLYAGSICFADVRGDLEAVVGLRSIMRYGSMVKIQAGAGIVMDSDPESEFQETEDKMKVPLKTIEPFLQKTP